MTRTLICMALLATLATPALAKSDHAANPHGKPAMSQNKAESQGRGTDRGTDRQARVITPADQATLLMNLFSSPEARGQLKAKPSKAFIKRLRDSGVLLPNQEAYFLPPGIAKKLPPLAAGTGRLIVDGTALVVDVKTGALILNLGKLF